MFEFNYLAIIVTTVVVYFIGFLWHGPLFGKVWIKLMGYTEESMKAMKMKPLTAMILGFISTVVTTTVMAFLVELVGIYNGSTGIANGLFAGLIAWIGFVGPITLGGVLWENRSWTLWFFNSAHNIITLLISGMLLASL